MTTPKLCREAVAGAARTGVLLSIVLLILSCTDPLAPELGAGSPIPSDAGKLQSTSAMAPGDVIRVDFPGAPEMSQTQKIRSNGRLSLPMVGEVTAGGKSPSAFQSELKRRYKGELQNPEVVVSMVSVAAVVYVSGEVLKPGKVPLDRPLTVLEAVLESGGFAPAANPKKVSVARSVDGRRQRYEVNLADALAGTSDPFYLKPYDYVYVSQRTW